MASSSPTASNFGLKRPSSLDLSFKRGRRKSSWQSSNSSVDSDVSETSQESNWRMEEGEDLVNSVYSFLKMYLSSSESSNNGDSLDVRIAQAMDLVTTALKSSIRNEFDKYQDKIEHLEEFAAKLKSENETLRQHVDQQVLDQFKQQQQKQQQGTNPDELQQLLMHQQKLQVQLKQQQHLKQQLQLQQQVHKKSQMGKLLDSPEQLQAKQLHQLSVDDFGCDTSDGILDEAAKLNGPHLQN